MNAMRSSQALPALVCLMSSIACGCAASHEPVAGDAAAPSLVGTACLPENLPVGGFMAAEAYLETGGLQCRSAACLVSGLTGNPRRVDCAEPECVTADDVAAHIYCTCRCSGDVFGGSLCGCPAGFDCVALFYSGPEAGGYCVRSTP